MAVIYSSGFDHYKDIEKTYKNKKIKNPFDVKHCKCENCIDKPPVIEEDDYVVKIRCGCELCDKRTSVK